MGWNGDGGQQQFVRQRHYGAVLTRGIDLQFRSGDEIDAHRSQRRHVQFQGHRRDETGRGDFEIAAGIGFSEILQHQATFRLNVQSADTDFDAKRGFDGEDVKQIHLAFALHHGVGAGGTKATTPLRSSCWHDIRQLIRIVVRICGRLQLINEVLRQVVAVNKPLQNPDFLIDAADVGDKSEAAFDGCDVTDTPLCGDHEVRGKSGRIDHHYANGIHVKQLQIRRADFHAGLGEHFQSVGANLQRECTAEPEQFQSECVVVIKVRHMEDQFAGDSNQEGQWLNIIALCQVGTVLAHACQSQRFRLRDIRGIELQIGKRSRLNTEGIQSFESCLQFGDAPQIQAHFADFNDQTCCCCADRPQPEYGHGSGGIQCRPHAGDGSRTRHRIRRALDGL